jgi:hypothetical protein
MQAPSPDSRQFNIESELPVDSSKFEDVYVCFGGYFGNYGPHMFAAAPEMLEALKSCVQIESDVRRLDARYGYEIPQSWQDAFSMIKAAIAKAEGRAEG